MIIRSSQLEAFQAVEDRKFAQRLLKLLSDRLPESLQQAAGDEGLEFVRRGIARARGHGFTWQSTIADFVGIMVQTGSDFDRHPAVAAILERTDLSEGQRMPALLREITQATWTEIRMSTGSRLLARGKNRGVG